MHVLLASQCTEMPLFVNHPAKVHEDCLVKLLCSACGEDQAEQREGINPKTTSRWETASTQYSFVCKER